MIEVQVLNDLIAYHIDIYRYTHVYVRTPLSLSLENGDKTYNKKERHILKANLIITVYMHLSNNLFIHMHACMCARRPIQSMQYVRWTGRSCVY
jgi:hypothetical protein